MNKKQVKLKYSVKQNIAVNIFAALVVQEKGLPFDVVSSQYPSISYEEAQEKIKRTISTIDQGKGVPSDEFFAKMLSK